MSVCDKTGVPARVEKVVAGTAGEVAVRMQQVRVLKKIVESSSREKIFVK